MPDPFRPTAARFADPVAARSLGQVELHNRRADELARSSQADQGAKRWDASPCMLRE